MDVFFTNPRQWLNWLPKQKQLTWHEPPLRGELFTVEQLRRHAITLANQHKTVIKKGANKLLTRLARNEKILRDFNVATIAGAPTRQITPAAEWLLDNFYLIEEQIRMAQRHLPRNYSRELPRLVGGRLAGYPRVYELALELIMHVDARVDEERLSAFISAYQTVEPLKLGELWAVPIMLRLALIENLRRVTIRLHSDRQERNTADVWADKLQAAAETEPSQLIVVLGELVKEKIPLTSAFVTQFIQRLGSINPPPQMARHWIEQCLTEQGMAVEHLIAAEGQNQAADQVSISHTIASLRFLSSTDWREFVETMSVVDQTLRRDPADVYGKMDFATRDRYRHQIERLSRYGSLPEGKVAEQVIALASQFADKKNDNNRAAHTGYYLIDKGRPALEAATGVRWPLWFRIEQTIRKFPLSFYLTGIFLSMIPATVLTTFLAWKMGLGHWSLGALCIVLLVCFSQLAVALVNWIATVLVSPQLLARLDFSDGVPADYQTMVVVPTMLTSPAAVASLIETLEIHYLANRDENLYFALLTDFRDSPQETIPEDKGLLQQIRDGVNQLNQKYRAARSNIFFLFHRPRKWNASENIWMGYERKRGKLSEFNALLRGGDMEKFSEIVGDVSILPEIKFVITLDTDTQLPRDAARQLIGTIAHPLNRPQFNPQTGIVAEGYGILQPRVGVSLPSAGRSWFVKLFAGDAGIDPYTRTVSDVYQDLFGEGSFIGKGIYDVDAFESAVRGRFPENTILSHDLIESVHARSALVNDVELFEEHPSRYNADVTRRHRWIRGDWQIAQWLLPRVPGPDARRIANPLSGLSLWKIFDNLRRSFVPAALTLLFVWNWIFYAALHGFGTIIALGIILLPGLLSVVGELFNKAVETPLRMHLRFVLGSLGNHLAQIGLTLVCLPYDAYVSLDAIARSLGRIFLTRKKLLEWQTAGEAEHSARMDLAGFYSTMWIAPGLAFLIFIWLAFHSFDAMMAAAPILALWFFAPTIAWGISQPIEAETPQLNERQIAFLRRTARKTWRFFETFVNEQENWLPPDNYQEHPTAVVATRTSPTNIGLALLANLAAHDFGYLSISEMMLRTRNSLATLHKLERYRGHFFNWYDTRTLHPLPPNYISTVDSGNLAGHFLTLTAGLRECKEARILNPQIFSGLRDTLGMLREQAGDDATLAEIDESLARSPHEFRARVNLLKELVQKSSTLSAAYVQRDENARWWATAFATSCREHLRDLDVIEPFLSAISETSATLFPEQETNGEFTENAAPLSDLRKKITYLERTPTLREVVDLPKSFGPLLQALRQTSRFDAACEKLARGIKESNRRAVERVCQLEFLAGELTQFVEMDFSFLYDEGRHLFAIGYNVSERQRDNSYYDLLASESRLASFVTVAQGKISQEHWFALGRLLASSSRGEPVLVSWSGSMFEYLMPLIVMPTYENTLLGQSCRAAVKAQIEYGRARGVPWGVSESGYNATDAHLNYQYRAFGVPGLGFKRGLAEDLVIAPYATVMALMVEPKQACENLERLASEGREGRYGFYEAVDYTPSRLPPDETSAVVQSFMAHHQGMSFLSFASLLLERPMQRRFLSHPIFKAAELLLQERVPKAVATLKTDDLELGDIHQLPQRDGDSLMRVFTNPNTPTPEVHLLSNGRYHLVVTNAGGGYSRWQGLAVTRWREDATRDCWGNFCYLRDVESGEYWSSTFQPVMRPAKRYEAIFTQARAEFRQRQGGLEMHVEISVSPEDDVELRRLTVTNHTNATRIIEFTSYAEVVLAAQAADVAHPAFSNLFVQTEFNSKCPSLLCTRRARSESERPPWMFHLMTAHGTEQGALSFETDRNKFIGRGRTLASPAAMQSFAPLSNSKGAVLDPVVSLRRTLRIAPDETVRIEIATGVSETREGATALIEKYYSPPLADRLFDLAWTHSQVTLRHLGATEADAQLYGRMASALIYANPSRRAAGSILRSNQRRQSELWSYGISGDLPIVLLRMSSPDKIEFARRLVQAHAYWRLKGLTAELIILNEDNSVYRQSLYDQIVGLITAGIEAAMLDKPGGIFVRRIENIPPEDRILLQAAARISLSDDSGDLESQFKQRQLLEPVIPELKPKRGPSREIQSPLPPRDLIFFNGSGGFTHDGKEYIIMLPPQYAGLPTTTPVRSTMRREISESVLGAASTPAPWSNVLANSQFGTLITESGGGYTWFENSHEYRLTPWSNDPVSDTPGEAYYLRDDETGDFWSPTPSPARGHAPYVTRHGFGYTVFEHVENGIASEMWVFVAVDAPAKLVTLKLKNVSARPRKISVMSFCEWVLGDVRDKTGLHIQTELDSRTGAILARNPFNIDFSGRVAFAFVNDSTRTITCDRREFIGRNGSLANPAALRKIRLSGKTGAGLDSCAAMHIAFELDERRERQFDFCIGAGRNRQEVQQVIQRFREPDAARHALEAVWGYWNRTLGAVYVETPDVSVNVLANGWLLYQTLSCRLWGRTGFYQSGGAFGFRDQLQDTMALVHAEPGLLREHLLRAAARQFREGDAQHWWHPPMGRGVRTHFSDDFLWLPYATCRYVKCIGDTGVLDETIPFLEGRTLRPEEESYYDLFARTEETATLYEHCVRAIENGLKFGEHGLPLIGCGDWNDGMNLVGVHGRGESVWLAFFLVDVLTQFSEIARARKDASFAARCLAQAEELRKNIEANAWDGEWYRRAYFDNGEPLGSATNDECQIDSLPQSWSVFTGAGDPKRAAQAMRAVEKRLVRRKAGLIQLFDPPFDKSKLNPGYIKGYLPGVRENGGQYTHAAIWTTMAFAELGETELAWELFSLMNPVAHGKAAGKIATYRVEPYVVAADIYAAPHAGRGGWTWYTGSAGWMYRLLVETLLGLRLEGEKLFVRSRPPQGWAGFKISYRHRETYYEIQINALKTSSAPYLIVDGQTQTEEFIKLTDDHGHHRVEINLAALRPELANSVSEVASLPEPELSHQER